LTHSFEKPHLLVKRNRHQRGWPIRVRETPSAFILARSLKRVAVCEGTREFEMLGAGLEPAIVRGVNNATGVALVEAYDLD
jgi:hypothetical protein